MPRWDTPFGTAPGRPAGAARDQARLNETAIVAKPARTRAETEATRRRRRCGEQIKRRIIGWLLVPDAAQAISAIHRAKENSEMTLRAASRWRSGRWP